MFNFKNILIFLVVVVGATAVILGAKGLLGEAATNNGPQNVLVSDAKSNEASISWITSSRLGGAIYYGTTPALGSEVVLPGISTAHLATLTNLLPNTTYYFAVGADSKKYLQDGQGGAVPYTFRTLSLVESKPASAKTESKEVAFALANSSNREPPSAFKGLISTKDVPKVLAEATSGGNVGTGTTGTTGSGTTPNGATTLPTLIVAAIASLFVGFGFKLLKN